MKQRRFSRIAFVVFEINWLVTKKVTDFSPMKSYKKLLKKNSAGLFITNALHYQLINP